MMAAGTLVLTACGGSGSSDDTASGDASAASNDVCKTADGDGPKIGLAYDVGGRGDKSFNDSAYAGIEKAVDELDATCSEAEAQPNESDTEREERLRALADAGFNPVIGVGFSYSPAAAAVAKDYPDTYFAVVDGYATALAQDSNLIDLSFAANQGSYLVGVAAALKSESGKIGFIGGNNGNLIRNFEVGYVAGAKAVDPKIDVDVQYLTRDQNDGETAFANPAGAKTAAEGMIEKGVDVIFHAAGKSGNGLFEAVADAPEGVWAIGVDSDQYLSASADEQSHILTSMLKRVDTGVFDFSKSVADGNVDGPVVTYDLSDDGVGYSTSGGFLDDVKDEIDGYADKIKSGDVKVPSAS
ncbi:BMP family ABC transporter substrate-binding protein [Nocardioides sp. CBS4Y-1]|uniref:BMP family ABC transporter substrate-binding protein n=2 Tax=Nocardioides acrostichi TaxID=2784339 RepID=A0A930YCU0_9ACTN|nr:BMP family ABC transporter substrate-binding protein [Nocardioides acrostichi]